MQDPCGRGGEQKNAEKRTPVGQPEAVTSLTEITGS
jgi:hypothetical protein